MNPLSHSFCAVVFFLVAYHNDTDATIATRCLSVPATTIISVSGQPGVTSAPPADPTGTCLGFITLSRCTAMAAMLHLTSGLFLNFLHDSCIICLIWIYKNKQPSLPVCLFGGRWMKVKLIFDSFRGPVTDPDSSRYRILSEFMPITCEGYGSADRQMKPIGMIFNNQRAISKQ